MWCMPCSGMKALHVIEAPSFLQFSRGHALTICHVAKISMSFNYACIAPSSFALNGKISWIVVLFDIREIMTPLFGGLRVIMTPLFGSVGTEQRFFHQLVHFPSFKRH